MTGVRALRAAVEREGGPRVESSVSRTRKED